jgi:protein-S-isoprenylcysteine O-methyltransferase Ste14
VEIALILAAHLPQSLRTQPLPPILSSPHLGTPTPIFLIAVALAACGAAVRLASYRALGRHFTFEVALQRNHTLVTSGPYAIVRHPSYAGSLLTLAGMNLALSAPGGWASECIYPALGTSGVWLACAAAAMQVTMAVGLCKRAPLEDAMLRDAFRKEWNEWAERVRYRIVPGIY